MKKVWAEVYKDYVGYFPSSTFKEDSFKDHLGENLKDTKSGMNDPKDLEEAILQDEDLMRKLMHTQSWKVWNVLKLRDDLMNDGRSKEKSPCSTNPPLLPTVLVTK